jgi:hypothetical protein
MAAIGGDTDYYSQKIDRVSIDLSYFRGTGVDSIGQSVQITAPSSKIDRSESMQYGKSAGYANG